MAIIRFLNILSIDVAFGASMVSYLIARAFEISLPDVWWWLLPLVVWWIYTADHLLDAIKSKEKEISERHSFHKKNFKIMLFTLLIAGIIALTGSAYLSKKLFIGGIIIGSMMGIYLSYSYLFKKYYLPKELLVSLIYMLGICFGALIIKNFTLSFTQWLFIFSVWLVVLSNLLLFSILSIEEDIKSGFDSLAIKTGIDTTRRSFYLLYALNMMIGIGIAFLDKKMMFFSLFPVTMHSVLLFIHLKKDLFIKNNKYRIIGDAVFLLPAVLVTI